MAIDSGWEIASEKRKFRRLAAGMIIKGLKKENPLLTVAGKLLGWYGGSSLPDRLSGPLGKEVMLLAARYALTLDLPRSLDIFAQRIGLEEVDNMVLAFDQTFRPDAGITRAEFTVFLSRI